MKDYRWVVAASVFWPALSWAAAPNPSTGPADQPAPAVQGIIGCRGTYNKAPRLANGRVDLDRLISELIDLKADTYNWLIWHAKTDWEDLHAFLPLAGQSRIKIWVSLVPPSESPPITQSFSEPFRLDYER